MSEQTSDVGAVEARAAGTERTTTMVVTQHEVRRFAVAIGAMAPEHHDVDAARALGYVDLLAPAYFFSALSLSLGRVLPSENLRPDGLALDDELELRVVAGGSTIEWHRPIVAGDEVTVVERFTGRRETFGRSGRLVLLTYERGYFAGGEVAVTERLVRIGRHE
jgi:acyl dehydratase